MSFESCTESAGRQTRRNITALIQDTHYRFNAAHWNCLRMQQAGEDAQQSDRSDSK
jgi:hypothetical protein